MAKLHEILAVETDLGETANKIQKITTATLSDKRSIFSGMTKSHSVFEETHQHLAQATENVEVQSTVTEQLDFASAEISRYWDVIIQKEEANQRAKADIIINGNVLASNVPAIVLLGMEKKLKSLLGMYNAIPTLDAAKAWESAPEQNKPGIYRTKHDTETQQSVTIKEWKEISPATPHHPAQLKEVSTIIPIGKYTRSDFSGAITSFEKAEMLQRLTALIRAVKSARQRANGVEIDNSITIGKNLFDYING